MRKSARSALPSWKWRPANLKTINASKLIHWTYYQDCYTLQQWKMIGICWIIKFLKTLENEAEFQTRNNKCFFSNSHKHIFSMPEDFLTDDTFYELALGPRRRPKVWTTLTNLLLYWILLLARPVFFFFFSWGSTLGVWPRTLPARAREPWTWKNLYEVMMSNEVSD